MTQMFNHFLIEGLDRLGKDTLIDGIQDELGYHQVLHFSKPKQLKCYGDLYRYQRASFRNLFSLLSRAHSARVICNRAHLGEAVYSPLYRGYSGDYVFDVERDYHAEDLEYSKLVLLTEDFGRSQHFVDDGLSFDPSKREQEQNLFLEAFKKSRMKHKQIVCVTDPATGLFRSKEDILREVLHG